MNTPHPRLLRAFKGVMMRYVPLMLSCREFDAFLHDYVAGSLSAGQRRRFRLHLRLCGECRTYLAAYEQTIALGKEAYADGEEGEAAIPAEPPERLVRAILDARRH